MKKVIFICLLTIISFSLFCQNSKIYLTPLPAEPVLKERKLNCIMQDHMGFIWAGGSNGFYRYNGYDLTPVRCPCDSFGSIRKIIEDSRGLIWILTESGISLFDPEMERSILVFKDKGVVSWTNMMLDSGGNIWASDFSRIIKISMKDIENNQFSKNVLFTTDRNDHFTVEQFKMAEQESGETNVVLSLAEDRQKNIWAGCVNGIFLLKKGKLPFIRMDNNSGKGPIIQYAIKILPVDENSLWIMDTIGLYLFTNLKPAIKGNMTDASLLEYSLKIKDADNIDFLPDDQSGDYLVMKDKKFYLIKNIKNPGQISLEFIGYNTNYSEDEEDAFSINSMFKDQSGLIWLLQPSGEVSRYKMNRFLFTDYEKSKIKNLRDIRIGNIYKDDSENLWILNDNKSLIKIQPGIDNIRQFNPPALKRITCFKPSSFKGTFWIGCDKGILSFDPGSGKFRDPLPQSKIANDLRNETILDLVEDETGIYMATNTGLFLYNLENGKIYKAAYRASSLLKMKNGDIWGCGNMYGIRKIEFNAEYLYAVAVMVKNKFIDADIDASTSNILYEDNDGFLWIGNTSGLHRVDPKTGITKKYKLFENTDFQEVMSIVSDDHNNLWLGTHDKLCRLNRITGKIRIFEEDDGVPYIKYTRNSIYKDSEGRIYLGGQGGFYSFHPDSFKTNDYMPPVVITDIKLFNKSVIIGKAHHGILTKNISYAGDIDLRYNQNDLSFEFAALDYHQSLKNKYAYKLEGYDKEWIYTSAKSRVATYTNLDRGTYIFIVKGTNNDEIWNETGTTLKITIRRPWWATTIAWCLYVLLFSGAIGGYIRLRLWRLKKEKLELERKVSIRTSQIEEQKEEILVQRDMLEEQNQHIAEQEKLKSRFFANVSHEFRTPLSLIQSPVEELLDDPHREGKERKKLEMVQRNVRRLLHLVNQLLDISKLDDSKMKLGLVEADVISHLKVIAGTFISLAETKSINYACHFPADNIKTWFDPDKLEKITGNLLSNAFKFTPEGGEVIFTASYKNGEDHQTDRHLEFSVKDTGPGIPDHSIEKIFDRFYQVEESLKSEGGGTGIGLSLVKEMVKLLHGDIRVKSAPGAGSSFTVIIPLGRKHLNDLEFTELKEIPEYIDLRPYIPAQTEESYPVNEDLQGNKKPIVLLVEDNREIRMQLAENFTREYVVLQAIDGMAGLKKATEMIPDLIITDLMMPRMDGAELCRKLKNDERTCHIPIIMLTARVNMEDKINGFRTGADDYVSKPFHMAEIKARVSSLIEQRRKLRECFSRSITLQPFDTSITAMDEVFLNKAMVLIEKNMNDENFDLNDLQSELNLTRSTLFRKIRALTGQCPTEFIRNIRLKRAACLLKQRFGNVTQVSLEVGFNNLSYFNRSFKKLFGVPPHDYARTNGS